MYHAPLLRRSSYCRLREQFAAQPEVRGGAAAAAAERRHSAGTPPASAAAAEEREPGADAVRGARVPL